MVSSRRLKLRTARFAVIVIWFPFRLILLVYFQKQPYLDDNNFDWFVNKMFSSSTQCKRWIFSSEQEIQALRNKANRRFVEKFGKNVSEEKAKQFYLTANEEQVLLKQSEYILRDFCKKFQPPMPRSVVGTSFHYFKRFYLNNSVMDYHPKHIMVTCIYLASKVEEFNVSITQFVMNVKGDREKAVDVILNNELLLMQHLEYHLTIHNPYRPIEGLLIDIKTRCPTSFDPEKLRSIIDDFLEKTLFTDAYLLFAPSQIALASILYAVNKVQENLETYVNNILFAQAPKEKVSLIKDITKRLIYMVKNIQVFPREQAKAIEKKLEKCRNQDNNPDSQAYKRKQLEMLNEEDMDSSSSKYMKISEDQQREEERLINS